MQNEYRPSVIYLSRDGKDAFFEDILKAKLALNNSEDEFAINSVCHNSLGQRQKLIIKLVDELPKKTLSRDVWIASAILIGCIAMIAVAFLSPKRVGNDRVDRENSVIEKSK